MVAERTQVRFCWPVSFLLFAANSFPLSHLEAMATTGYFETAFVQNVLAARQEQAQTFENAIQMGINMIMLQVATGAGTRIVIWTYDKVKKFWMPT